MLERGLWRCSGKKSFMPAAQGRKNLRQTAALIREQMANAARNALTGIRHAPCCYGDTPEFLCLLCRSVPGQAWAFPVSLCTATERSRPGTYRERSFRTDASCVCALKAMTRLREGFTTGTAAAAAAAAAVELLLTGRMLSSIEVELPPFGAENRSLSIAILEGGRTGEGAMAVVRKDGGDDPDATCHAEIEALATSDPPQPLDFFEAAPPGIPAVSLAGGRGVGRATLPGLPIPVGMAAINPVPRQQILRAVRRIAWRHAYTGPLRIVLRVRQGEALARHTLNPRLGIVGGISILGTQGTVKPFSHSAWRASILQGLDVAAATGCRSVCMTTGRRSETLLMARYPELPVQAFIQAADFAGFSLQEAAKRPFQHIIWGCFFGKLVKLAQGHWYTHAHTAALDMAALSVWCAEAGASCAEEVARCITATHALEWILQDPACSAVLDRVGRQAAAQAARFAGRNIRLHLFHGNGMELLQL